MPKAGIWICSRKSRTWQNKSVRTELSTAASKRRRHLSAKEYAMKKVLFFIRDLFEYYLPIFGFLLMFTSFILQVFFRYIVRHPLTWTQETIVLGFIWVVVHGACYTMRRGSHIKFTLFYDRLKPRTAAIFRLLGNIIIIITFAALIIPSWKYSFFVGFQKTAIFRIPLTVMFISFVYFLCSTIGYTLMEIIEDIKVIRGSLPDSKDHQSAEVL
jgi:TRAP-type C4-dicarboxylate transport system permease small subunit